MSMFHPERLQKALSIEDKDAAMMELVRLCRQSPHVRHWLKAEYATSPEIQKIFDEYFRGKAVPEDGYRFAKVLSGRSDEPSRELIALIGKEEFEGMYRHIERFQNQSYGGLKRPEIEELMQQYQAGNINLTAFLFVCEWKKETSNAKSDEASIALQRVSLDFIANAIREDRADFFRQIAKAVDLLESKSVDQLGPETYGSASWWKLNALLYLLGHPKERYRTGELREHLMSLGLVVDAKEIREFCKLHDIQRDERRGRISKKLAN